MNKQGKGLWPAAAILWGMGAAIVVGAARVIVLFSQGPFAQSAVVISLVAILIGAVCLILGFGLLRQDLRAFRLTVASCIVAGVLGSIFSAILGNVLPDLIENPRLAMPIMTAGVATSALFLVIVPGLLAYYLTRPARLILFPPGDASQGWPARLPVPVVVVLVALGLSALGFLADALIGIPFLIPGLPLEGWFSRLLWVVFACLSVLSLWRIAWLDRRGWYLAVGLFAFLLLSWSLAIMRRDLDWIGAFPHEYQVALVRVSDAVERAILGQIFLSNAAIIGLLFFLKERFFTSQEDRAGEADE